MELLAVLCLRMTVGRADFGNFYLGASVLFLIIEGERRHRGATNPGLELVLGGSPLSFPDQ